MPGDKRAHVGHFSNGEPYVFKYNPLAMVMGTVGVSMVAENGFTLLADFGLAMRVTKQRAYTQVPEYRYQISSMMTELFIDSGPIISVAAGYSFGKKKP